MRFGHQHRYEAISVDYFRPPPFGPTITMVLWRCACNAVTSQRVEGNWTLAQVRGERELTPQERIESELLTAPERSGREGQPAS